MARKFIRLGLIFAFLALPLIAWRAYLAHVVNQELASIRAAGLPTNGQELNLAYSIPPEGNNAALVMMKAFDLRTNFSDIRSNSIFDFKLPPHRAPLSPEQVDLLKEYVALNQPMLHMADEALKLPASRYPIDYTKLMDTSLPHLAWIKTLAELHQYKAVLTMQAGDTKNVPDDVKTILALAHTLDNEHVLISQLVRLRLIDIASRTLELRAAAGALSPAEIANLSQAFTETLLTNTAAKALIAERALTIPYFRMTKKQAFELNPGKSRNEEGKDSPLPYKGPAILRFIGYYELDYGSYLIGMRKAIALAEKPAPENLRAGRYLAHVGEESTKRQRTLSGVALTAYASVVAREDKGIATQRLTLTALAIEDYRNKKGHPPEMLSELESDFAELEDPFTGDSLHYHRTEKGYVIYSVGVDLKDNHGLEEADKKESVDQKSFDITFTVDR
jgi:hypothetical protein